MASTVINQDPVSQMIELLKSINKRVSTHDHTTLVAGRPVHSLASQNDTPVHIQNSPIQFDQVRWQNYSVAANSTKTVLDVIEHGMITVVELHANHRNVGMKIEVFGLNGTPTIVSDFHDDFETVLKLGWGLSPGDVKLLAGGISPDPHGTPNIAHPYLLRYKDSTEADHTGETGLWYSMAYTPSPHMEYQTRFRLSISNRSSTANLVRDLIVNRYRYVAPIATQHIHS